MLLNNCVIFDVDQAILLNRIIFNVEQAIFQKVRWSRGSAPGLGPHLARGSNPRA